MKTTPLSKILRKILAIENDLSTPLKLTIEEFIQADTALKITEHAIGVPGGKYTPETARAVMDWAIAFAEVE